MAVVVGAAARGVVPAAVPLGERYIADFYASAARLVVEVDGASHRGRTAADARRDRVLTRLGYRVLRLPAQLVLTRPREAVALVQAALAVGNDKPRGL